MNNIESEVKIKLDNAEDLFNKAISLGAVNLKDKEGLEIDVMYSNGSSDFESFTQHAPEKVLRLRKAPFGNLLTYKEKLKTPNHDHLLQRTEIETFVENYESMKLILDKLGFKPYRTKEKYVKKLELDGLIIELHKLPFIGDFLEIEGEQLALEKLLKKLGLKIEQGINRDYTQLFYDYCTTHGMPIETPQTFVEAKKVLEHGS